MSDSDAPRPPARLFAPAARRIAGILGGWFFCLLALWAAAAPPSAAPFSRLDVRASRDPAPPAPPEPGQARCFLVVLVDAKGIDLASPERLLETLRKRPRGGKHERSLGHAWIILGGPLTWIECGHTGEFGLTREGGENSVQAAIQRGDPNPLAGLFTNTPAGSYEAGSGGHAPSLAVEFDVTPAQYQAMRDAANGFDHASFAFTRKVCTDFAAQIAAAAGIHLGHRAALNLPRQTQYRARTLTWWSDPQYSRLAFGSPDVLEASLRQALALKLGRDVTRQHTRR